MAEGGFFKRLLAGLTKTRDNFVKNMDYIFRGFTNIDDEFYEELEEILIMGDIGVTTTENILEDLKRKVKEQKIKEPTECKELLIESIRQQMDIGEAAYEFENRTSVVLVVGVNGVGKTTTIGKLAANLSTILLLIVSSFPILALVFIYGGITILDAALLLLCYVTTAFLTGSIGVFCSAYFRKSTIATVASYCITVLLSLGTVAAYELSGVLGHGNGFNGSSGLFYLMLFNPGATFRSVLSSQIGVGNEIADFFPWLEQGPVSFVSEHWMLFGTVTQIGLAVVLVWLAVRKVEPVKRRSAKKTEH